MPKVKPIQHNANRIGEYIDLPDNFYYFILKKQTWYNIQVPIFVPVTNRCSNMFFIIIFIVQKIIIQQLNNQNMVLILNDSF